MEKLNYILVDYSSDDYEFVYQTKKDAYKTIISIEKNMFNPSAKLALLLCTALEEKFENVFYF